jgi:hypothetical protein
MTVLVEVKMKPEHCDEFKEFMKQGVEGARNFDSASMLRLLKMRMNLALSCFMKLGLIEPHRKNSLHSSRNLAH